MATYSQNTTQKINRRIVAATTVAANAWAIVDYTYSSGAVAGVITLLAPITRNFGPGDTVPGTITVPYSDNGTIRNLTYTLGSGVEFLNTGV